MRSRKLAALLAAGASLLFPGVPSQAASHSDAPLIKLDPQANLTDVYAFIRVVNGVKLLNVVVNCRPFSNPGDGVTYDKFSDDALYSIHIADPTTGAMKQRFDFRFSTVGPGGNKNVNTILNYGLGTEVGPIMHVGDARQNYVQTYTLTRTTAYTTSTLSMDVNGNPLMVPPPNVGPRTTPAYDNTDPSSPEYGKAISGATTPNALDRYTKETVYKLDGNMTSFCGSRDDSFYADAPGIFDLLNPRILKTDGKGVDDFKGYNVLTYSLRIPVDSLGLGNNPVVGVYASVSRQRVTLRKTNGAAENSGPWIQVNRMGNPLFNEVLVAVKDKDNYNRMSPTSDATTFKKYAENPELATLLNVVYGDFLQANFGRQLKASGRSDLVGIFIPDVLRVDTSTGGIPVAGEATFNRLSFLGGDTVKNAKGNDVPSGWPNGRRIGDDVVDIALIAVANDDIGHQTLIILGDNVDHNDMPYNVVFPYVATPHSGTFIRHDPEL